MGRVEVQEDGDQLNAGAYHHLEYPGWKVLTVTVIVPTLQEADRIGVAIDRLREAGFEDIRVADGGSTDGTWEIAEERGAVLVRGRPGRANQMNAAAIGASGEVLWFLHADVKIPGSAGAVIERVLSDPTVVAGAFTTRTVCEDGSSVLEPVFPLADLRSHYSQLPYGDQGLFVRREVFERIGGFPPQPLFEDLEISRRLWRCGRIVVAPERVEVSARRFLARPVYYTAVMNLFPVLYRLGVGPELLAHLYGRIR